MGIELPSGDTNTAPTLCPSALEAPSNNKIHFSFLMVLFLQIMPLYLHLGTPTTLTYNLLQADWREIVTPSQAQCYA